MKAEAVRYHDTKKQNKNNQFLENYDFTFIIETY